MNRPILFSTEMVQAIMAGRKTMTRRIVKHDARISGNPDNVGPLIQELKLYDFCPYGKIGDILWVREAFCLTQPYNPEDYYFGYKAGGLCSREKASEKYDYSSPDVWKPGIHMPKEACRIFLKITNINVQRLHEITHDDATREGIMSGKDTIFEFGKLWSKINGAESWHHNPWVWVISFEKCEKPEGF